MARVFIRLKLAMLGNGFRRGWQQAAGTVIAIAYALPLSMLAARGVATLGRRGDPAVAEMVIVIAFAVMWLGWIVGPLLAFGMDETLDPRRLALLPLRRSQLLKGLLAASAVGIGPLATAIVLYGVLTGYARMGLPFVVVALAVVAQFLLCVGIARAATTSLSRRLSSRRGRDMLVVVAAMFGLVVAGLAQLPNLVFNTGGDPTTTAETLRMLRRVADALTVLPPAWAARAIGAATRGDHVVSLAWLAAAGVAAAAVLWWWAAALRRALATGEQARTGYDDADLFPAVLGWLPRTRLGAGVAKDVRYAWRVPQLRVQYLMLVMLLVPSVALNVGGDSPQAAVLLAPLALLLLGITGFNAFGADRGAVWVLDITGPQPRTDLLSKTLATAALGLPITAVVAAALAVVTGGWAYVPLALVVACGVQGAIAGVGVVLSVLAPFPLPDSPTNVFAANAGAGCAAVVLQGVGLLVQLIVLAPIAAAVALTAGSSPGLMAAAAAGSVLWGGLLWWVGLLLASRRWARHRAAFVAALQPRVG